MSLKYAIMGFLSYQSLSGYDLKKVFDRSIQHFWPANQSQIYRTLAELAEDGYVEQEVIERDGRLDLKVYHITEAGRAELHHWLSTPLSSPDYREPFLIQLYFSGKISDEELIDLLKHEIRAIEGRLEAYFPVFEMYRDRLKNHENPREFFLSVLTLEYGILSNHISLEWLRSVAERVIAGDYIFRDFSQTGNR
jgi:DNA-binding PadR family transcriptional regulator